MRATRRGYRYNKEIKKLEIHEDEAKIVREIFERYISGQSASQIAGHFYRLGTSSRQGGRFYTKAVQDFLLHLKKRPIIAKRISS